jgi:hypothetical protein
MFLTLTQKYPSRDTSPDASDFSPLSMLLAMLLATAAIRSISMFRN